MIQFQITSDLQFNFVNLPFNNDKSTENISKNYRITLEWSYCLL